MFPFTFTSGQIKKWFSRRLNVKSGLTCLTARLGDEHKFTSFAFIYKAASLQNSFFTKQFLYIGVSIQRKGRNILLWIFKKYF